MLSFYTLPSTVMNHPTHSMLKAAYSFYNVSTKTSWLDLVNDALIIAKKVKSSSSCVSSTPSRFIVMNLHYFLLFAITPNCSSLHCLGVTLLFLLSRTIVTGFFLIESTSVIIFQYYSILCFFSSGYVY